MEGFQMTFNLSQGNTSEQCSGSTDIGESTILVCSRPFDKVHTQSFTGLLEFVGIDCFDLFHRVLARSSTGRRFVPNSERTIRY